MKTIILRRTEALRNWMRERGLQAMIVLSSDPHGSEYLAAHYQVRAWLTGFTGSAGCAVVTMREAALWTDSRYFLQAAEQLRDTPFQLMKEGEVETPSVGEWLLKELEEGSTVGVRGLVCPASFFESLREQFRGKLRCVSLTEDVFDEIWKNRPSLPSMPVYCQPLKWTGKSATQKIKDVFRELDKINSSCKACLLTDLSEIAWTLNLRGGDIEYNPLFMSYLLLRKNAPHRLYVAEEKIGLAARESLRALSVEIHPYADAQKDLKALLPSLGPPAYSGNANMEIASVLRGRSCCAETPVQQLKMLKNDAEQAGFRDAMEKDGVAMTRFLHHLDEQMKTGKKLSEATVAEQLEAFRREEPSCLGLSFPTIAGYEANGAIVHYQAEKEHCAMLRPEGLLLLDSGAQYISGTTDLTRTIALGPVTEEQKEVYTYVLKGMIGLSRLRFPKGTPGLALDLAARQAMWQKGYDYGHGTGHGVGSHLCVHEGPHQIRKNIRPDTLRPFLPGMTVSDEPGIYVEGKFGARIENILLAQEDGQNEFGDWCKFETLTLCPIDLRPVKADLLTKEEKEWLNAYHQRVRKVIFPLLQEEDTKNWLARATQPLV